MDKMRRNQDLSPLELVEMFVTVFCFLKDSSDVSQTLLDDFKVCQGYSFLVDFILRYVFSIQFISDVVQWCVTQLSGFNVWLT